MPKKYVPIAVLAAAMLAATSAHAVGLLPTPGPPGAAHRNTALAAEQELPDSLPEWCGFVAIAVGANGGVPTVRAAVDASLATGAPTQELGYFLALEGAPHALDDALHAMQSASAPSESGLTTADGGVLRQRADQVDGYIDAHC